MVARNVDDGSYELSYDVEGRVVEVTKNAEVMATFGYDGDGRMVTATLGTTTTVYIGNCYEKEGSTVRTYYYHNGQRVATPALAPKRSAGASVRKNGTLYWLLTDHLGSTAKVVDESGTVIAERRYYAFGDARHDSGTLPTKYRFTGQREESTIELYFYNARW